MSGGRRIERGNSSSGNGYSGGKPVCSVVANVGVDRYMGMLEDKAEAEEQRQRRERERRRDREEKKEREHKRKKKGRKGEHNNNIR